MKRTRRHTENVNLRIANVTADQGVQANGDEDNGATAIEGNKVASTVEI